MKRYTVNGKGNYSKAEAIARANAIYARTGYVVAVEEKRS